MYKLYYSPGSCSLAIHALLNEIGVKFELENVAGKDGNRTKEFLKVNPRGQVPVFFDGSQKMVEGAAIMVYLAEKHNSALLPQAGEARAKTLQWLMFCNATLHPAYSRGFFLMRNLTHSAPNREQLFATAVAMINKLWAEIEDGLNKTNYLAGNKLSLADILLTVIANWSPRMPGEVKIGPKTKELLKKVSSLPNYQKALRAEGVEYKVV